MSEALTSLRTRILSVSRNSSRINTQSIRYASVRRRTPEEQRKNAAKLHAQLKQDRSNTVFAPKTRLAVGVVFIGALIYSMVPELYLLSWYQS